MSGARRRAASRCCGAIAVGAALAALAPKISAREGWFEARTATFIVVSNAGEMRVRQVADVFEDIRTILEDAWTRRAGPLADACRAWWSTEEEPVAGQEGSGLPRRAASSTLERRDPPLTIVAVARERDLREIVPQFWEGRGLRPVAVYWPGPHRHYIAVRLDRPAGEWRRHAAHEYVHYLARAAGWALPAWLDEGLAELWSTATVEGGHVMVGWPDPAQLGRLRRGAWIPLPTLLAAAAPPPPRDRVRLALFYAEAWALAHFVTLGPGAPRGRIEPVPWRYLDALRAAGDSVAAAREVFGDLAALERALVAYVRTGPLRVVRFTRAGAEAATPGGERPAPSAAGRSARPERIAGRAPLAAEGASAPHVRTLTEVDSLAIRAQAVVDGQRPRAAGPLLARALQIGPRHPAVLETLGILSFRDNRPQEAARWLDSAIATGSASPLAYYYRALVPPGGAGEGASAPSAAALLERALALDPSFAPAAARLAASYARDPARLDDAVRLARHAATRAPYDPLLWSELSRLLAAAGRLDEARRAGRCALAAARSPSERDLVGRLLGGLDR